MQVLCSDAKGRDAVKIVQDMVREQESSPKAARSEFPLIVVEGFDGTGKTTLVENLKRVCGGLFSSRCSAAALSSPPRELSGLRPYFDAQPAELRRAFYVLGNYACAMCMPQLLAEGPVITDRFWPSTIAYALAHDLGQMPEERPELLEMPHDLLRLLPCPSVFLILELDPEERARRVRARAAATSGPAVTAEEEALERSRAVCERLEAAYRALTIGGAPLTPCEASGTAEEVCARALRIIDEKLPPELVARLPRPATPPRMDSISLPTLRDTAARGRDVTVAIFGTHTAGKKTIGERTAQALGWEFQGELGELLRPEHTLTPDGHIMGHGDGGDWDMFVHTAETQRDLRASRSRVVETWHVGNLAWALQRGAEAKTRATRDTLEQRARDGLRAELARREVLLVFLDVSAITTVRRRATYAHSVLPFADEHAEAARLHAVLGERGRQLTASFERELRVPALYLHNDEDGEGAIDGIVASVVAFVRAQRCPADRAPRE